MEPGDHHTKAKLETWQHHSRINRGGGAKRDWKSSDEDDLRLGVNSGGKEDLELCLTSSDKKT